MSVRSKIYVILIMLSTLPLLVVSALTMSVVQEDLRESVGHHHQQITHEKAASITRIINERIKETRILAATTTVTKAVLQANTASKHRHDQDIQRSMHLIDQQWIAQEGRTPTAEAILNNGISKYLRTYQDRDPSRYGEIILTDRHGATLAMTNILTDYYQADEYWWQQTRQQAAGSPFLDDRGYDMSARSIVLGIALPLFEQGEFIGVLKLSFKVKDVLDVLTQDTPPTKESILLVRSSGSVIVESGTSTRSHVSDQQLNALQHMPEAEGEAHFEGDTVISAYAPIAFDFMTRQIMTNTSRGIQEETWQPTTWLVMSEVDKDFALAAVNQLRNLTWNMLLIAFVAALLLAAFLARSLTQPILALRRGAEVVGKGQLDHRTALPQKDEFGALSRAFDDMVQRLRETVASRDELNREIDERKHAETLLRQFKSTLDQARDCIFIFDPESLRFSYVNQGATEQVGYSFDELMQMTPLDIKPEFDEPRFRKMAQSIIESPTKSALFQTVHKRKNDTLLPVEIFLQHISAEGESPRFVAVVRDITERKAAEAALQKMNLELEERVQERTAQLKAAKDAADTANRAKSVFLANMSHELRTPMNAILGFAQLMQRDAALSAEQRDDLRTINRSGQHLLSLINDVLEISKIETGRTQIINQAFDLPDMLTSIEEMIRVRAEAKSLTFTVEADERLPRQVRGDEHKLRQILINLLGNAVKFTDTGHVTLRVMAQSSAQDTSTVCFAVEDSGMGIAAADQARIFEPFMQVASTEHRGEGTGLGLGLAISRKFVRLMRGELSVKSELSQGSVFRFEIPLQIVQEEHDMARSTSQKVVGLAPEQPDYRILIVEDKPDNRLLLKRLLLQVGFQVREAVNGQEAITCAKAWHPHLIWMDMRMPVLDGYEATRRIKAMSESPDPVIIALTASAFDEEREEVLAAGCDDFVRKPLQETEIFAAMEKHLGLRYLFETAEVERRPEAAEQLDPEELAKLPAPLLEEIKKAAVTLDLTAFDQAIEQTKTSSPALFDALYGLSKEYRFDLVLKAIQMMNKPGMDAPKTDT